MTTADLMLIPTLIHQRDEARRERDAEHTKKDAAIKAAELYESSLIAALAVLGISATTTSKPTITMIEANRLLASAKEPTP